MSGHNKYRFYFIFIVVLQFYTVTILAQCGIERWDVKTLTDKDTTNIDFKNIVQSRVSEQCVIKIPSKVKNKPLFQSKTTLYEIEANVIEYRGKVIGTIM